MDPKQKNVTEIVVKKINNFLEILKIQSQKNRRETQPLALSKLLVVFDRPLSQKHKIRRQIIRKQKMPTKSFIEKTLSDEKVSIFNFYTDLIFSKQI